MEQINILYIYIIVLILRENKMNKNWKPFVTNDAAIPPSTIGRIGVLSAKQITRR